MEINQHPSFIHFLSQELRKRSLNNPKYSLRTFARELNLDSSFLSKLLTGKRSVTLRTVKAIGEKLHLSSEEIKKFSVVSQQEKTKRRLGRWMEKMPKDGEELLKLEVTVDESRIEEAKKRCQQFQQELLVFIASGSDGGKKFNLTFSVFPLE